MGWLSFFFGSGSKLTEREEAARLGLTVDDVIRDLPEFEMYSGELVSVRPHDCVRYSIERRAKGGPTWSLVQRTLKTGGTYPNGYLLTSSAPLPAGLEEQLRKMAQVLSEELFEFEATSDEVAVYWAEWGGPKKVQELHEYLDCLASY